MVEVRLILPVAARPNSRCDAPKSLDPVVARRVARANGRRFAASWGKGGAADPIWVL